MTDKTKEKEIKDWIEISEEYINIINKRLLT